MVYQNNNNRINPDAVVDAKLNPVATPTNQEIKYRDESQDKLKKTAALGEGLSSLGQGIIAISPVMQRHAQEAVEKGRMEAGINKDNWGDVSRKIPTISKFNPYLKDTYEALQFQDIRNAAIAEFNGLQDKEAMDETEYLKKRTEVYQKMTQAANKQGLKYQNYSGQLVEFDKTMSLIDREYYSKHAAYMQEKVFKKIMFNMSQDLSIVLNDSKNKASDMRAIVDSGINELTANGASDETIVKNLTTQLAAFIMDEPEKADSKTVKAALTGLKVNGIDIKEVDATFMPNINKLCKEAITAKYAEDEAKWNYENAKATHNIHLAQADYDKWVEENPNASNQEKLNKATELKNQYGLNGYANSWYGTTNSLEDSMLAMKNNKPDPEVIKDLNKKAIIGSLTEDEIEANRDYLDSETYAKLFNTVEANHKAEGTKLESNFKQNYIGTKTSKPKYQIKNQANYDQISNGYQQLQGLVGKISSEEYNKRLRQLTRAAQGFYANEHIQSKNVDDILKSKYQKDNVGRIKPEDINTINKELSRLGMVRNSQGVALKNVTAASAYSQNRNGKPHLGIDVNGVKLGQPIYCPYGVGGTLIRAGHEDTMGYYAIIKQGNQYLKIMHMSGLPKHKIGTFINSNEAIGYVGNSGIVRGNACLHIEFWNSKLQWSTISEYRNHFYTKV